MVLAVLLIATIAVAGATAGYVVVLSQQREKLAEAKYAVSLLTEFSDAVRSIGFEGQKAAYVRYSFQYGAWEIADGGVTLVALSSDWMVRDWSLPGVGREPTSDSSPAPMLMVMPLT